MNNKPWETEDDYKEFTDKETGYTCRIIRHPTLGFLRGYVTIPISHPLFGKTWREVEELEVLDVHGGVNFAEMVDKYGFTIGFSCDHFDNLKPNDIYQYIGQTYKNMAFVEKECRKLAKQLKEYGSDYEYNFLIDMRIGAALLASTLSSSSLNDIHDKYKNEDVLDVEALLRVKDHSKSIISNIDKILENE